MAKTKKPWEDYTDEDISKYRQNFVKQALRRASYRWPWRNIAIKLARIERGIYKCANCSGRIRNKDKQLDHTQPVVEPESGFQGFDKFITRLLPGISGWQVLCRECHLIKTGRENEQRRSIKKLQRTAKRRSET